MVFHIHPPNPKFNIKEIQGSKRQKCRGLRELLSPTRKDVGCKINHGHRCSSGKGITFKGRKDFADAL